MSLGGSTNVDINGSRLVRSIPVMMTKVRPAIEGSRADLFLFAAPR